jgi:hypothetical protein
MGEANELTFQVEHMPYPQIYNQAENGWFKQSVIFDKKRFYEISPRSYFEQATHLCSKTL